MQVDVFLQYEIDLTKTELTINVHKKYTILSKNRLRQFFGLRQSSVKTETNLRVIENGVKTWETNYISDYITTDNPPPLKDNPPLVFWRFFYKIFTLKIPKKYFLLLF